MKLATFLREVGQPVAYYPKLAKVTGGVLSNLFLCQMYYWQGKQDDPNGWIYKTQSEIEAETGLTRTEQETARRLLRQRGLIKERYKGLPRRLEFWLSENELENRWFFFLEYKGEKSLLEDAKLTTKTRSASTAKKTKPPTASPRVQLSEALPEQEHAIMQDSRIIACRNPADNNAGFPQSSRQESCFQECRNPALLPGQIPQSSRREPCIQVGGVPAGNIYSENTAEITAEITLSPQPPATWKPESEKRERKTELEELEPDPGNPVHQLAPLQFHPGLTGNEPNFVVQDECDAAVAPAKIEIKASNPDPEVTHFSPEPVGDDLTNWGPDENSADAKFSIALAQESNAPAGVSHQPQLYSMEPNGLGPDVLATAAQPNVRPLLPPSRPPVQSQGKPRLNPNSRFHSQQEMDDFYQALKQLGKSKGIAQPSAWAIAIIKGINSEGLPCEHLDEFRSGLPLGSSEQEEWECEPGKPWPTFITFLTRRLKKTGISDEEAIEKAYATLRDRNKTRDLWASCKRLVLNLESQWQRDQALGVSNAYIPPELLPQEVHSVERAMSAMQQIQSHSVQAIAPGAVPVTEEAPSVLPPSAAETSTPSRPPCWDNLERSYSSKLGKNHVERVLQQNPDWGFQIVNGKISPNLEAVQRDYADPKTRAGLLKQLKLHPEFGFEEVNGTITEIEF